MIHDIWIALMTVALFVGAVALMWLAAKGMGRHD